MIAACLYCIFTPRASYSEQVDDQTIEKIKITLQITNLSNGSVN